MLVGRYGFSFNLLEEHFNTPAQLNSFAELIAGGTLPRVPGNVQGLLQYGSALTTYDDHQVFFTNGDSEEMQSVAAYWTSIYTEGLAVIAVDWQAEGGSPAAPRNDVEQVGERPRSSRA